MHWYHAYGQRLASEFRFPELREASAGPAAWTFRLGRQSEAPPLGDAVLLGQQTIYPNCDARLYRTATGRCIAVDDTGRFELNGEGEEITWYPVAGGTPDFGRAHLLGRVLATCMHFSGALVLHGSAVSYPGGAVVFLAPKHTGKSTLALALTLAGARLISDDTIVVTAPESGALEVRPGVPSLRLFSDSATRVAGMDPADRREDGKYLMATLSEAQLEDRSVPLAAVYLLAAAEALTDGAAAGRRPVSQPLGAAAMVGQGKITQMLGATEAPTLLRRAAGVASRVPVYQLAVHRDLNRLDEVARLIASWHELPQAAQ